MKMTPEYNDQSKEKKPEELDHPRSFFGVAPQSPVEKLHELLNINKNLYNLTQYFQSLLTAGDLQSLTQFMQDLLTRDNLNIPGRYLVQHFYLQNRDAIADQIELKTEEPLQQAQLTALVACANRIAEIELSDEDDQYMARLHTIVNSYETNYLEHLLTLSDVQNKKPRTKGEHYLHALEQIMSEYPANTHRTNISTEVDPQRAVKAKMSTEVDTQWAVDVISQCNHMHGLGIPLCDSLLTNPTITLATDHLFNLLLEEVVKNPKVLTASSDTTENSDSSEISQEQRLLSEILQQEPSVSPSIGKQHLAETYQFTARDEEHDHHRQNRFLLVQDAYDETQIDEDGLPPLEDDVVYDNFPLQLAEDNQTPPNNTQLQIFDVDAAPNINFQQMLGTLFSDPRLADRIEAGTLTFADLPEIDRDIDHDAEIRKFSTKISSLETSADKIVEETEHSIMLLKLSSILMYFLFAHQKYDRLYREFLSFHDKKADVKLSQNNVQTPPRHTSFLEQYLNSPRTIIVGSSLLTFTEDFFRRSSADTLPVNVNTPTVVVPDRKVVNLSANRVRDQILLTLQQPIAASETHEQYLDRLAAVIVLLDTHELYQEHKLLRWIHLIHTQQIVTQANTERGLTAVQLELTFDAGMSNSAQEYFDDFVATRPGYYLSSLCRVYRQHQAIFKQVPSDKFIVTMIKHYLTTAYPTPTTPSCIADITHDNATLINTALNFDFGGSRIITILLNECTLEQLKSFILWDLRAIAKTLSGDSTPPYPSFTPAAIQRIGEALVSANRHRIVLSNVQNRLHACLDLKSLYTLCMVIFKYMQQDDRNINSLIETLRVILNKYADHGSIILDLHANKPENSLFSDLFAIRAVDSQLYTNKILPLLNDFVFKMLSCPELTPENSFKNVEFQYNSITEFLLCLLKAGASLLTPQKSTNALLFLIKAAKFDVLTKVFNHYRYTPEAINQSPFATDSVDHDPLFLAMNNNADYRLTMMMLELGFSQTVVKKYLADNCTSAEVAFAATLRSNASAIRALNTFSYHPLRQSQNHNERLSKEIKELRHHLQSEDASARKAIAQLRHKEAKMQQRIAELRQQLEHRTSATPKTPSCAQQITLGILTTPEKQSTHPANETIEANSTADSNCYEQNLDDLSYIYESI